MPATLRSRRHAAPRRLAVCSAILACAVANSLAARTLAVGPTAEFKMPSAAIAGAHSGDTVHIAVGQYFDCATVGQDRITIEGEGAGTVLTDKACAGKGLLIIDGKDVTVRNLTLQRARVVDGNGAGIRAEGGNLTVEGVHFINNQDGILSADNPAATIRIIGSEFVHNGSCQNNGGCAHGIYIGNVARLQVERSRFFETLDGHHIKSKAMRTEISGTSIEDGPEGTSSYLVDVPNGGSLLVTDSTLEKGPHASNHSAAIIIGEEGVTQPTEALEIRNTKFTNDMAQATTFVRNITATPAQLINDTLVGQVRPLEGDGSRR